VVSSVGYFIVCSVYLSKKGGKYLGKYYGWQWDHVLMPPFCDQIQTYMIEVLFVTHSLTALLVNSLKLPYP